MIDVPIEVKDALREGSYKKNYRIVILNDDGTEDFTIDNDNLVKESVSIDERMNSGDTLKFGLCEGSSLEFQYFEKENITGRQMQVFCDVEYGANAPYVIPMGFFTVKNCSRQASTGIIKVTAYNKLQSDYLDAKANQLVLDTLGSIDTNILIGDIQKILLTDYQIKTEVVEIDPKTGHAATFSRTEWNMPFYFTELYGLDTPISAYKYWETQAEPTTSTPIYVFMEYDGLQYDITDDSSYWNIEELFGKLSTFEQNIYDRIKYIFDSAKLRTTSTIPPFNNGLVTGKMFCDYICKNIGFQNVFGIHITQNGVTKKYSTIQWQYENENNISHTVNGDIDYVIKKTWQGSATIKIQAPWRIGASSSSQYIFGSTFAYAEFNEIVFVEYWEDSSRNWAYSYLEPITFGDGTEYDTNNLKDSIKVGTRPIANADAITVDVSDLPDYTLRDIVGASYETQCQFGQLDRVTDLFSGVELNHSRLLPQETLYPDSGLYPGGAAEHAFKSQYSKLWADEGNIHKWKYLIITYKGLDGEGNEKDYTLQRTVNNDGTDNYNCSDNWLFRNLVWTAEQIGEYADAMVAKMQDITWFPFEMWCAGLPYLETGDEIEISLGEETYTSYILQRQLKGIQNLQDTYINGTLEIF